ncbi:MAG: hypothetical protein WC362_01010 [Methanoregula sp.]
MLGILGLKPVEAADGISYERSRILTAFANQAALALERVNPERAPGAVPPGLA